MAGEEPPALEIIFNSFPPALKDIYSDVDSDIKNVIDNMPTAYDIGKVVEELEKESFTTTDTVCGGIFEAIRTTSAIEIVKRGGTSANYSIQDIDNAIRNKGLLQSE